MKHIASTIVGKTIQHTLRHLDRGGQALPGLVVERLHPKYLVTMLSQLPEGVIIITGTNGKTTTTKMVAELLKSQGKRVLTNATGSNLSRGFVSSVLEHTTWGGKLPYDLAVLEMDEAYAKRFVRLVLPRWVLALNVTRDQLDRFGEVDRVAKLIGETMQAAREGVVVNADDPYLSPMGTELSKNGKRVIYFGVNPSLLKHFFNEATVAAVTQPNKRVVSSALEQRVSLTHFEGQRVGMRIDGVDYEAKLRLSGQHNFQNLAGALALVMEIIPDVPARDLVEQAAKLSIAFGRGEVFKLKNGSSLQLVLVKNPASFAQSLTSYEHTGAKVMLAINDNYADGRDVSWLWDVDFSSLSSESVAATAGSRAADMALRLQYDKVKVDKVIDNLADALEQFIALKQDKIIFSTYTAMLKLYALLKKQAAKG